MSAEDANLQAQVETVLGTLVKAATVELIKLFESRFRVSARSPSQCAGGKQSFEVSDSLSTGGTKRSVGVQVEAQGTFGMLNFLFLPCCCGGIVSWRLDFKKTPTPCCSVSTGFPSCTVLVHLH